MDFVTAEEKFNELQARIRRGEPMSEDQYQEELAKLMVQDDSGVFWSLEPGTGRWLYFNGTEWMPGTPPRQAAVPPPAASAAAAGAAALYEAPSAEPQAPPESAPSVEQPTSYVPSEAAYPTEYTGTYTGEPAYGQESVSDSSHVPLPGAETPLEPDAVPTYVRMPEPETTNVPPGGIPPRPVREASPLAVPGGERAWLPFAFGALVLLLCAVVLFFGVRGLPQFNNTAGAVPTEEPTLEETEVLPTATVELEPTKAPKPTKEPTAEPQPTPEPQVVKATTTEVLNIRQGPARTTPSLGKLQKGQEVTVIGRNGDGTWIQIEIPAEIAAGTGWISAEFATITGDVNTLPVTSGDSGGGSQPQATETPTG